MNCMIDLETLGTQPGCIVLSLGACTFGAGEKQVFYSALELNEQKTMGLRADRNTLDWWHKREEQYVKLLKECHEAPTLYSVLLDFSNWLHAVAGKRPIIWGNGADFDIPILARLYEVVNMPKPWYFYDQRCYRTLKNLLPEILIGERIGEQHHALIDAQTQAEHAKRILAAIRKFDQQHSKQLAMELKEPE